MRWLYNNQWFNSMPNFTSLWIYATESKSFGNFEIGFSSEDNLIPSIFVWTTKLNAYLFMRVCISICERVSLCACACAMFNEFHFEMCDLQRPKNQLHRQLWASAVFTELPYIGQESYNEIVINFTEDIYLTKRCPFLGTFTIPRPQISVKPYILLT